MSSVVLVVLLVTSGCGGSSKSFSAATKARAAAAAKVKQKIEANKRKLALARQHAAEQRIAARKAAIAARLRALAAQRAHASTTTTTTPTTGPSPTTPTTTPPPVGPPPAANLQRDLAAIQATLARLNAAFRTGVADGIAMSETVNYRVVTGTYSASKCAAFEAQRGGGVVQESLALHSGSLRADPEWTDPVTGLRPVGRVYGLVLDDVQTLVPTGEQRSASFSTHATVRTDGHALLFLSCG